MGTLLDAYALIALLGDEAAAAEVARIVGSGSAAISTVNLAEAGQRVLRDSNVTADELRELVGSISLTVVPFTEAHAWRAAELRATHDRRAGGDVSLGDCCLVAVATRADNVATADQAVLRMAAAEGIATIELPGP